MVTYTTDELLSFTKKKVMEVARTLDIKGRTKMDHHDLIDKIVETTTQPHPSIEPMDSTQNTESTEPFNANLVLSCIEEPITEESTSDEISFEFGTVPSPQEFFELVAPLETVLDVHRACNALLDSLSEKNTVATISKKLTSYKKLFYTFKHQDPSLNETIETKLGTHVQHIAGRLLGLSDEQKQTLGETRSQSDNARAGYDSEGEVREVEKAPIDIEAIIRKSLECLQSNDPHTIGCGILVLTGLRVNEQNMPAMEYEQWGLITREVIVVDEFLIGFKGLSKKKKEDDINAFHARVTLAPAKLIVDAQRKFLSSPSVQAIPSDYEKYRKGFMDSFSNRFGTIFGKDLSTIEAYTDDGKLLKANGSPHKARAFYACALRAILKGKNFRSSTASAYIQQCLAHESQGITIKYLGRYDESEFINPVNINIPKNINELGKMQAEIVEEIKEIDAPETIEVPKPTFDIDTFINALDPDLQVKFQKDLNSGMSLTDAVISVMKSVKEQSPNSETKPSKVTVSDEVGTIVEGVMTYNMKQEKSTDCVIPAYSLVNKISERLRGKNIAYKTFETWMATHVEKLDKELINFEIPGGIHNSNWNGKHHRKTMNLVLDSIVTILSSN